MAGDDMTSWQAAGRGPRRGGRAARSSGSGRPRACTRTTRSTWERRDVVMTNWRDGSINFEQRGVEFPDSWSVNAANIVTTKYFRGAVGTAAARVVAQAAHRPGRQDLPQARARSTATSPRPADAEIFEHELTWMLLHQVFSFNSPVWFNVGTRVAAAGQRLLHPRRRRLDGLDPRLVQGGGADLQGRLRLRRQPLPHPLVQGAALLRRHRLRPGQLHARRRRLAPAPSSPAAPPGARPRWSSSTSTTPTSRSSSRPRRARRTRSARCATPASTWTSAASDIVSVQYQNANNSVRVSDEFMRAVEEGGRLRPARPARRRGHRDRRRQEAVPQASPRPRGSAPTRASSTTTRSTTGTPARRPAGSPRPTRARSTCTWTTRPATSPR